MTADDSSTPVRLTFAAKHAATALWRRRIWTIPLAAAVAGVIVVALTRPLEDRLLILSALIIGLMALTIAYVASFAYRHVYALRRDINSIRLALKDEIAASGQGAVEAQGSRGAQIPATREGLAGTEHRLEASQSSSKETPAEGPLILSGRYLFEGLAAGVYDALNRLEPKLMLDVGAAVGFQSRKMLETCPGSRVIAFEPFEGNWPHFEQILNGTSPRFKGGGVDFSNRVELVKKAVCDHSHGVWFGGATPVADDPDGWWHGLSGFSSVGRIVNEGVFARTTGKREFVESCTLDEILGDRVAEFAKVDVQGGEANLLRGARKAISERRVKVWLIEYTGQPEILRLLEGYTVFDSIYYILPGDNDDFSDFDVVGERLLSTGDIAIEAWPRSQPQAYESFFAENLARYQYFWTDLLFVDHDVTEQLLPTPGHANVGGS